MRKSRFFRLRRVLFTVIFVAVLAIGSIAFWACTPTHERLGGLISELRENVFEGYNDSFAVSVITGRREEPFLLDGNVGELKDFTLITVTPKQEVTGKVSVRASINETYFSGELVLHPFSQTLSIEFGVRANTLPSSESIAMQIMYNGVEYTIVVASLLTEQMINYQKALEIAENKLKHSIEIFKEGGELHCEIFVRLMVNQIDNSGGLHWYVAFVGANQTIFAVLIVPITMQVVAIRN